MGAIGDSYDNAMAESLWASLEKELIYRRSFKHTRGDKDCNLYLYQLVRKGRDGDRVSLADSVRERGKESRIAKRSDVSHLVRRSNYPTIQDLNALGRTYQPGQSTPWRILKEITG
jgi:hypothetical protein